MSLQAFQRALVDLTLAPEHTRRLVQGDLSVLDAYELNGLEGQRIMDVVHQPGMAVNCTLARGNRFDAIGEVFPMTCVLLEPILRELLAELWGKVVPTNYQFSGEEEAFARAIRKGLSHNRFSIPYLHEVFNYECLCWDLAQEMRNQVDPDHEAEAIVEFNHPPDLLLEPLSKLAAPPVGLPTGSYRARIVLRGTRFHVEMISASSENQASKL